MFNKGVAIFFSVLFMTLIMAPTILTVAEADYDIAIFMDTNEEEEKKGNESLKDIKIKIIQSWNGHDLLGYDEISSLHDFYSNRYNSQFKELISPPPERNIL